MPDDAEQPPAAAADGEQRCRDGKPGQRVDHHVDLTVNKPVPSPAPDPTPSLI
jgi:hypothetical protein